MKCKQCKENEAIKYSKYTKGDFCSRKCARAFSTSVSKERREEINKKISTTLKKAYETGRLVNRNTKRFHTKEERLKQSKSLKETYARKRKYIKENVPFNDWPMRMKTAHIFTKYGNHCQECGYTFTSENGKGPFEIHHIDGNHSNNTEDNLTVLCLNCHWKTPNWRFRGMKHTAESIKKGIETKEKNKAVKLGSSPAGAA